LCSGWSPSSWCCTRARWLADGTPQADSSRTPRVPRDLALGAPTGGCLLSPPAAASPCRGAAWPLRSALARGRVASTRRRYGRAGALPVTTWLPPRALGMVVCSSDGNGRGQRPRCGSLGRLNAGPFPGRRISVSSERDVTPADSPEEKINFALAESATWGSATTSPLSLPYSSSLYPCSSPPPFSPPPALSSRRWTEESRDALPAARRSPGAARVWPPLSADSIRCSPSRAPL